MKTTYWGSLTRVIREFIEDVGKASMMLLEVARELLYGRIIWAETFFHIDRFGIGSLPIVTLSASFIGMAIAVQFAKEIVIRYGATNIVGGFVGVAMFRELAPIFVAIVLTGSIGASMTAEIGSMKVTDQVDALKVFHISPVHFLVVPRIVATALVGPALTVFGVYVSLISGQIFTEILVDVPAGVFWDSVQYTIGTRDVVNMLVKAFVFACTIAMIAASNGLGTEGGSAAVGQNTTKTVIWCLLSIFILNYVLTSLFFRV